MRSRGGSRGWKSSPQRARRSGLKKCCCSCRRQAMDWSKLAEEKINQAMASGELEPRTGKGKPINMDEYFAPRDEDRVASHVLRNSGHVPEEVSLLGEIARL